LLFVSLRVYGAGYPVVVLYVRVEAAEEGVKGGHGR
jgi:hypothetical protein